MKNLRLTVGLSLCFFLIDVSLRASDQKCLAVEQENFEEIKNLTISGDSQELVSDRLAQFSLSQKQALLALSFKNQSWDYARLLIHSHVKLSDQVINDLRTQYGPETALHYQNMQERVEVERKKKQRECRNCLAATASSGAGSALGITATSLCQIM